MNNEGTFFNQSLVGNIEPTQESAPVQQAEPSANAFNMAPPQPAEVPATPAEPAPVEMPSVAPAPVQEAPVTPVEAAPTNNDAEELKTALKEALELMDKYDIQLVPKKEVVQEATTPTYLDTAPVVQEPVPVENNINIDNGAVVEQTEVTDSLGDEKELTTPIPVVNTVEAASVAETVAATQEPVNTVFEPVTPPQTYVAPVAEVPASPEAQQAVPEAQQPAVTEVQTVTPVEAAPVDSNVINFNPTPQTPVAPVQPVAPEVPVSPEAQQATVAEVQQPVPAEAQQVTAAEPAPAGIMDGRVEQNVEMPIGQNIEEGKKLGFGLVS